MVRVGGNTLHAESGWCHGPVVRRPVLASGGDAIDLMERNGKGWGAPTAQGPAAHPAAIVILDHAEHLIGGVVASAEMDKGAGLDRHGINGGDGSAGDGERASAKSKPKLKPA